MPSIALNKLETNLGNKLITINDTAIKIKQKPHSFSIKLPNNKNYLKIHLLVFFPQWGNEAEKMKIKNCTVSRNDQKLKSSQMMK